MRGIRAALARLAGAFTRHGRDAEIREEMQAHLEMATWHNIERGMRPEEARRQALLASGGLEQAAEAVRDQRGLPWLETIGSDLTYAVRSVRRTPRFTVLVMLTLALGIGANTAIFSVVNGVMLRPLPHHEGDRLVYLRQSVEGPGGRSISFSVPEVRDLRNGVPSLAAIAEYSPWTVVVRGEDGSKRIDVGLVTGNYFEVMGLAPVLGRLTSPADDGPGVEPVMVLTHAYWLKAFGGDPHVVGQRVRVDGTSATVIGVLEPAPFYPDRIDALFNMVISDHHLSASMVEGRTHRMTEVVARLAPGATEERARLEVEAAYARMQDEFGESYDVAQHPRIAVIPFPQVLAERARLTLWLLMGAAAFVLIISVASVTNLTLMRAVGREHEFVVRAALGAGVGRLRRLLVAENLALALLGGSLGLVIAWGGMGLLTSLAERYSPRADEIRLDAPVFAFMFALSVAVGLLLSFVRPLPRDGSLGSRMLSGAHRISGSLRKNRLQSGLVVVQIAVSVVLLAGAGLLTRTVLRLADVHTGLATEEILTIQVPLLTATDLLTNPAADPLAKARYEEMRQEISALPGVLEVGIGSPGPLRNSSIRFDVKAEGEALAPGEAMPRAQYRTAGPEFFRAAAIPLISGREFNEGDRFGSESVVIVNQTFADRLFPGRDPVGLRMAWTGDVLRFTPISGDWRTIVGVAGDTRDGGLEAEPEPAVYLPFAQSLAMGGTLVVRARDDAGALVPAATRIVRRIAPTAPIEDVMTVPQIKDLGVAPRRLNAALISSFGILALIIAAVGIGGVLAFSVRARSNEIGIRMSLGADRRRVQRMVLKEGGALLAAGLALGTGGAVLAARVIQGLLFGVAPYDPATYLAVVAVMSAIGLGACWIPAARAARVDPVIAMRAE